MKVFSGFHLLAPIAILASCCAKLVNANNGSVIIAEGPAAPNSYVGDYPNEFEEWCTDVPDDGTPSCSPSVSLEVVDAEKGKSLGFLHAWVKEFTADATSGSTIQFKEFIILQFTQGQIWAISTDGGHNAGAFADPTLIPPKQQPESVVVLVGGAEGDVIGGTGKYSKAEGRYSLRLKLEFNEVQAPVYYDELFLRFRDVKVVS